MYETNDTHPTTATFTHLLRVALLGGGAALLAACGPIYVPGQDGCVGADCHGDYDDPGSEMDPGGQEDPGSEMDPGSSCYDTPGVSVDYLTGCDTRRWVVYDATQDCFNGSTFDFGADGSEVHYDNCLGSTRDASFSLDGDIITTHGYPHQVSSLGEDLRLVYVGSGAPNDFKIRIEGAEEPVDSCDLPAISSDYLSACSSQKWLISDATFSCFNGSTFVFYDDGTEVHYDNCLGQTWTSTYSVNGDIVTTHGYDHAATLIGDDVLMDYVGSGTPNTFTMSRVD